MIENSNNFYFSPYEGSRHLLIIFSGAGARNFNCFKLLMEYPINRLFIRDETRSWYQNPVVDHWQDIDGMIAKIKTISDRFYCENIICMGGSMGGYAAMITAAKIHAGRALLFSPQTILDHRLPNQPSSKIKLRYPDAFSVLAESPETEAKFYVGTEDLSDIYNVSPALQVHKFQVEFFYCAPHNLMNFLFRRDVLLELISSYLENRYSRVLLPILNLSDNPELLKICCDFVRGFYLDNVDDIVLNGYLDQLQNSCPTWPAIYHHRGKMNARSNRHALAIEQFEEALMHNENDHSIYDDLGRSAIQEGEYKKAEKAFLKANEYSETPSPQYLSRLGAALMLQKKYDEAISEQENALKLNNKFGPAYYQLGLIFSITNRYHESIKMFENALAVDHKHPNLSKHLATARQHAAQL